MSVSLCTSFPLSSSSLLVGERVRGVLSRETSSGGLHHSLQRLQVIQNQRWKQETLPDGLVGVRAQFVPEVTVLEELQRVSCSRFCLIDEVPIPAVGDLHL